MYYPKNLKQLIHHFDSLPGIGPKSAERLAFHLLKRPQAEITEFAQALLNLNSGIQYCPKCHNLSEKIPCFICQDPNRIQSQLCVVTKPQDLIAIERTKDYKGLYHVLWGTLSAIEGITPDQIKIKELLKRIETQKITELILALNTDIEGESTVLYLKDLLRTYPIRISRLAKGLPMGSEVEYADEITLSSALEGRISI